VPEPIWITPTTLHWTLVLGLPMVVLAILLLVTRSWRGRLSIPGDRRLRALLILLVLLPAAGVLGAMPLAHDPSNSVYIVDGNLDTGARILTIVTPQRAYGMMPWLELSTVSALRGVPADDWTVRPRRALTLAGIVCAMTVGALVMSRGLRTDCGRLGRCRHCGYDLRGQCADRCPECGQETTMNLDGGNPCLK
jgi:hypothetical protein